MSLYGVRHLHCLINILRVSFKVVLISQYLVDRIFWDVVEMPFSFPMHTQLGRSERASTHKVALDLGVAIPYSCVTVMRSHRVNWGVVNPRHFRI